MRLNALLLFTLIVFATVFYLYQDYSRSPGSIYAEIEQNLDNLLQRQQEDLIEFESDLAVYSNPFAIATEATFSKRVYINGSLIYWNDNAFLPAYGQLKQRDTLYTLEDGQGLILVKRREVVTDHDLVEIYSAIRVAYDPPVKNQHLRKKLNPKIFADYEVTITENDAYHVHLYGRDWFGIKLQQQTNVAHEIMAFALLCLFGMVLGLLLQNLFKKRIRSSGMRFVLLAGYLILLRIGLHLWTRYELTHWDLFDPLYFTSGIFYYTLGDLLLNGTLFAIISILLYRWLIRKQVSAYFVKGSLRSALWLGVNYLFVFGLAQFTYYSIWVLLEHSQIELDINHSILFDPLRVAAYSSIALLSFTILVFFTLSLLFSKKMQHSFLAKILIFGITYGLFGLAFGGYTYVFIGVIGLTWWLIDLFGLTGRITDLRYQTFVYLIVLFSAISVIHALAVYKHHERYDRIVKERFANRLLIKNDILGEFYLNQILSEVEEDRYIRSRLLSRLLIRQNIREKIRRQFLGSYFNKYDISVYLFDAKGNSLQPERSSRHYDEWKTLYQREAYTTDYPGIYFIWELSENVRNKYVCFLSIQGYGEQVGYIVMDLTLKKYIPTSVFPELLMESRYYMGGEDDFDYAVYHEGEVLYKQGRFSFENKLSAGDLDIPELYTDGIEREGVHYYGLETHDGRKIIIVSSTYKYASIFANFSFIFLVLLSATALILTLLRVLHIGTEFNLSTKIQLYLGLSFIIPLAIVSMALINTLNKSYREEIDHNFQKRSFNIAENLVDQAEDFAQARINIDEFSNGVVQAGALAQSDMNVYDVNGRLITTNQPDIFRLGLISTLLDPVALFEIKHKNEHNIMAESQIGTLDFKTSYTALRSYQDGQLLGILSMPYFDSKNHLRRQQVEVFTNLISIFTMIFIISTVLGNAIVGRLVKPLKEIGQKLSKTSLQEFNEPIHYEANDEIGGLVKAYNLMLVKLEESKEALARSQKESAWKEIARQVAHEIKNPLTPMRLKIQQMMRAFGPQEKNYKTCQTLIDQIDSLSSIADSFSEFAKMPVPENELVNVCMLLDKVTGLYQTDGVEIHRRFDAPDVHILVDPRIFSRIFTNILLNAIQATEPQKAVIHIRVVRTAQKVTISFADNGPGIPTHQRENIFTPYFSTKSKGTGIGLAVAKKGIENAGGHIWFESEEGGGTTFYISLPVFRG